MSDWRHIYIVSWYVSSTPSVKYIFSRRFSLQDTNTLATSEQFIVLTGNTYLVGYLLVLSFYLQGHSILQASQDFSTLLTWMAGTNSPKTVNAAATTPRKSKNRIACQVQDGGTRRGRTGWTQ